MSNEEKILELLTQMDGRLDRMDGRMGRMEADMSDMKNRVAHIELTLENEVTPALDALAEGQDILHQKIKELATKQEVSDLRDEVAILRRMVAVNTRDIEELKKAQ